MTGPDPAGEPLTDWQREFLAQAWENVAGDATITVAAPRQHGRTRIVPDAKKPSWDEYIKGLETRAQQAEEQLTSWQAAQEKSRHDCARVQEGLVEVRAELADANALLLDLAGQLWDAERELDALRAEKVRADEACRRHEIALGWLNAARKVLEDTHPYKGMPRHIGVGEVANAIAERIDHYERRLAEAAERHAKDVDELVVERRAADLAGLRMEESRDKWKRIAAELAADHLGDNT